MTSANNLRPPEKAFIQSLPDFQGLAVKDIRVPRTDAEADAAWVALRNEAFLGFDTESKPVFVAGQPPGGPDVIQFSTLHTAYVLQMHSRACRELASQVLASAAVKVGFGLRQDQTALELLLGLRASPLLDLDTVFRQMGYRGSVGVRSAVAIVFGQRFVKSKRVTTSNWASQKLDHKQLRYAANDAYAALRVFTALQLPEERLPLQLSGGARLCAPEAV